MLRSGLFVGIDYFEKKCPREGPPSQKKIFLWRRRKKNERRIKSEKNWSFTTKAEQNYIVSYSLLLLLFFLVRYVLRVKSEEENASLFSSSFFLGLIWSLQTAARELCRTRKKNRLYANVKRAWAVKNEVNVFHFSPTVLFSLNSGTNE